jgi:hypothetical protein
MNYDYQIVSEREVERFLEEAKKLISAGYRPVGKVQTVNLIPGKAERFYNQGFSNREVAVSKEI